MPKKLLAVFALLAAAAVVVAVGLALAPGSAVQVIAPDSPCPAAGCASGSCHGFDAVPGPDGVHEMECPEAGCSSVECHGWESLIGRYHQASDMSLNMWILMPTALVLGLWLLVRCMGRRARPHGGAAGGTSELGGGPVPLGAIYHAEAPASSRAMAFGRRVAERAVFGADDEEGACHEA